MRISMKQARVGANLTQAQIAKKMKIHPQTYAKIEKHPGTATIEQAFRFAEITGVSIDDIFFADKL